MMNDDFCNVVDCKIVNDDFTIKIFHNFRTSQFYAHVILETEDFAKMLSKTKYCYTAQQAEEEAIKYVKKYLEKNK